MGNVVPILHDTVIDKTIIPLPFLARGSRPDVVSPKLCSTT